ncbi:MAG: DUF2971 domain-containing protein [Bacteroidales bacterium]|nr:DUF2971 domain-containing protein [Bacteroidales bacterium]
MNDFVLQRQETINRFLDSCLGKNPFSVSPNVRWHAESISEFDLLISYKTIILAVVEITQSLHDTNTLEKAKQQITHAFHILNCHFGIISDNSDYYICETNNNEYHKYGFDNVVHYIINHQFVHDLIYKQNFTNISNVLNGNKLDSFVERLQKIDGRFSFSENDETNFWQKLLKQEGKGITTIYRYTSLDTVLSILSTNKYRMYGIVGMNDKSEIDYFDDYCNSTKNTLLYPILNNLFLSSCSLLKDDLTMWRLYGDNAKGVCLSFDIKPHFSNNFILQAISYADDNGQDDKLDIIKDLLKTNVVFSDIDKWKHFFKAKDYSIEKEVRLLFQDKDSVKKRDWIKSNDNSIINPFVEFDLLGTEFPLELKEIILGPKCPEKETNRYQLIELIHQNNLQINVEVSTIKNYR